MMNELEVKQSALDKLNKARAEDIQRTEARRGFKRELTHDQLEGVVCPALLLLLACQVPCLFFWVCR